MFLLLFLLPSVTALCPDTATCISRVKEIVAAPRRFWFGEQRRAQCQHRQANPIDCFGPSHLAVYHSLGSRLFRAKTYHTAYLRNLEIFPRITYRALPGHYRACDHEFHVGNVSANVVEADPDMSSVEPFLIRKKPEIGWHGLRFDEEFTILMTDVGFGTLNYLVTNFPIKPKVLKEYETSENFRPVDNPLVLLVFRKGKKDVEVPDAENFDLTTFMLKNDLADNLVGLSLVVVGSDAFAIERQRLRGTVDNCHSLIRKKVALSASTPLISHLPLDELRAWLTISFEQPRVNARICCQKIRQSPSFRHINANSCWWDNLCKLPSAGENLCCSNSALHWLVVDIPASELSYGARGITKFVIHYGVYVVCQHLQCLQCISSTEMHNISSQFRA
uniref:TGF_BETA_2 domain-containing protein n=1 Tax=Heterorhabditis bacteriophora TaxID=37862 RepID=A0A1I7XIZ7_HETBA